MSCSPLGKQLMVGDSGLSILADYCLLFLDHSVQEWDLSRPKNEAKSLDTALPCLKKSFI